MAKRVTIRNNSRKHPKRSTRKHKKSTRSHKKRTRSHKKRTRSRRGRGMMNMFKKDPPCVSPGTKNKVWIGAFGQDGTYTGELKVDTIRIGNSRNRQTIRECMANGQGKWVSNDGKHTIVGLWKNDRFQEKIPNPTNWHDKAGNACPGPHCGQPQAPAFAYRP